jgi:hypothetical protein
MAALAALRPSSLGELVTVPGLGPVKATRYGEVLLELITGTRATA